MIKDIIAVIVDEIKDLPFVDWLGGLVQVVTSVNPDDNNNPVKSVMPVVHQLYKPEDPSDCTNNHTYDMVPNSGKKSIIYFEDLGSAGRSVSTRRGNTPFQTTVRLTAWMNKDRLVGDQYANITAYCINEILSKLTRKNPKNVGSIKRLSFSVARIPVGDASLFSKFTYDETIRQYLMPPFECFAIDFLCKYEINACGPVPNFQGGITC